MEVQQSGALELEHPVFKRDGHSQLANMPFLLYLEACSGALFRQHTVIWCKLPG